MFLVLAIVFENKRNKENVKSGFRDSEAYHKAVQGSHRAAQPDLLVVSKQNTNKARISTN